MNSNKMDVHKPQLNRMPNNSRVCLLDDGEARCEELCAKINRLQTRAQPIKQEVLHCIDGLLEPNLSAVLELKFIHVLSAEEIGQRLFVSTRTVTRWYAKAINTNRYKCIVMADS